MNLKLEQGVYQVSNIVSAKKVQEQYCKLWGLVFGGAYTLDFQRCGHCVDPLAREAFQNPVSINKCNSTAGVKTSRGVGVKTL